MEGAGTTLAAEKVASSEAHAAVLVPIVLLVCILLVASASRVAAGRHAGASVPLHHSPTVGTGDTPVSAAATIFAVI